MDMGQTLRATRVSWQHICPHVGARQRNGGTCGIVPAGYLPGTGTSGTVGDNPGTIWRVGECA